MRLLIQGMRLALGSTVILIVACALRTDVSFATALRSVGLAVLTSGYGGGENIGLVAAILASVLGWIFWTCALIAAAIAAFRWLFRLIVRVGNVQHQQL
jgi:hypothetical protein